MILLHPLITIDYEIFGTGTGDILRTIVKPMKRIERVIRCARAS